jgi:pyridoxal/pyridoxine/pyridoxamine kinase|tara:strand:+ start:39 stop:275 length:237 start_codon:yes stop_codon:yes gene_type:complete
MATLKEIYNELEMIMEDIDAYVEEADNANLASDVAGNVKNPLDKILSALDGIMDDESAGVYENDEDEDIYEREYDLDW